jgi:hypothetical protein
MPVILEAMAFSTSRRERQNWIKAIKKCFASL